MSTAADDPAFSRLGPLRTHAAEPPPSPPEAEPPLPYVLDGRYRLYALVGRGSLATTYRALDLQSSRVVAVKRFAAGFGSESEFQARFLARVAGLAELAHPSLVRVLAAGVADERLYLVTEAVQGNSLRRLMQRRGRLPIYLAVRLAAQIAEALEFLHSHDVVHGDLRPENVLLEEGGRIRLADFDGGLVAAAPGVVPIESLSRRAPYQAPEQVRGEPIDARTDVYALGALVFEMLVGEPPSAGPPAPPGARRRFQAPPHLRGERPDVCWGLEHVIRLALAPEPRERPPSVAAFRRALLSPPREVDLAAGMAESTWAFRAASLGHGPPAGRIAQVPLRHRDWQWPGRALPFVAPLVGTLAVLFVLVNTFDLMPPLLAPLQVVRVPDLQNQTWGEATAAAQAAGLEVVKARPEPCDDNVRDFVIRQDPAAGAVSHRGAKVRLVTCSGLRVPSLLGESEEQARVALAQRDWPVADVRFAPRPDAPPGTIVAQQPEAGLILPDKQPLVLTVAQAP